MATVLEEALNAVEVRLTEAQTQLSAKNFDGYSKAKKALDDAIAEYNSCKQKSLFRGFKDSGAPFVAFSKAFFYEGKRTVEARNPETGELNGISVENGNYRMSLKKFIDTCELDGTVISDISKVLDLLVIREKQIFEVKPDDYAKVSAFFLNVVKKKAAGETPDSNTQITKMVQGIMEKCGIECRITNHDMHYLAQCAFNHNAKAKGSLKVVTPGKFQTIFVDVMNHFTEGTSYSVLEKKQKDNA